MKRRTPNTWKVFQRYLLVLGCCVLWRLPCSAQGPEGEAGRYVDLTYSFDESTVFWPTAEGFKLEVLSADTTEAGFYYAANQFSLAEHGGTHLDAPVHFSEETRDAEE